MTMFKRILLAVLVLFLLAQFLRPDRSVPAFSDSTDLLAMTHAPDDIRTMVTGACYDCHSYQSTYPWYAAITPVNYWLQDHINEARHEMNFSRWDTYATSKHAPDCEYLIRVKEVEVSQVVGVAQYESIAKALSEADLKLLVNSGDVHSGIGKLSDLFTAKGASQLNGLIEGLKQTDEGKQILGLLDKLNPKSE